MTYSMRAAAETFKKKYGITDSDVDFVLQLTQWKCKRKNLDEMYIPILFETELREFAYRKAVNTAEVANG